MALTNRRRKTSDEPAARPTRVGFGYDVHQLVKGRPLILGGVPIPYAKGLLGHSDADVLVHAIMDALLGAAGERDIGWHFPNTSARYKGISSLVLLAKVDRLLRKKKYRIVNLDATIVAEKPRLAYLIPQMQVNISRTLGLPRQNVGIKVTTSEGLGFCGRGEGIVAFAVAAIQ